MELGIAASASLRSPRGSQRATPGRLAAQYSSTNLRQLAKSWYVLFFQIPWLPEYLISMSDFWLWKRLLVRTSRPGTFAAEDLTRYAQAWSHPRAVTAMLNWYRAAFRHSPKFADLQVHIPTRILWGKNDIALLAEEAQEKAWNIAPKAS